MSGLVDAITVEISDREQRRTSLTNEIDHIDQQLEQLRGMHQTAETLTGEGLVEEPKPVEPSRTSAKPGGRASRGRNGGKAPGGRRPAASGSQPGSAPSGTSAPARTSSSANGEGGSSKRAAVLAFVQAATGPVKRTDVAAALNMTGSAVGQHLSSLVKDEAIVARGATSTRTYEALDGPRQPTAEPEPAEPSATSEPAAAPEPSDAGGGSAAVDVSTRILTVLRTATAAWRTSEVAYQASKGGEPITKQEAERALLELLASGQVARFTGQGGGATWRAAE